MFHEILLAILKKSNFNPNLVLTHWGQVRHISVIKLITIIGSYNGLSSSRCQVIIWTKHFLCYWLFVRGIHRAPVDSPNKGPVTRSFVVSLMLAWTNCWANTQMAGYLGRHDTHVTSLQWPIPVFRMVLFSWFICRVSTASTTRAACWWATQSRRLVWWLRPVKVPVCWELNPLRAKFFRGRINIYLHFMSLFHIDMTPVL